MSELVSTNWVYKNLDNRKLVILDCSWHMPHEKRNSKKEYDKKHIKNAYFFDIDKISISKQIYLICYLVKENLKKKLEVLVLIRIH